MTTSSLVFIDARVSDYASLIEHLPPTAEVVVLDSATDGLEQISTHLAGRTGIGAIHVVSHGSQGALYLGNARVDGDYLTSHSARLASIGSSLTETGDILLYGCNVAQGEFGVSFVNSLAQITGADVAASDDLSGIAPLGGDAALEWTSGSIESDSFALDSLQQTLATNTAPTFIVPDGKLTTDFGDDEYAHIVLQQADGKLMVGGSSSYYNGNGGADYYLAQYNSDGTLDTGFGGDGKLVVKNFGINYSYSTILVQSNNQPIIAGESDGDFYLSRYKADGTLDTEFHVNGKLTTDFGEFNHSQIYNLIQTSNAQLVVAGYAYNSGSSKYEFALARYSADGTLDSSFDGDGKLTTNFEQSVFSDRILQQADGKLIAAGHTYSDSSSEKIDFALARYNFDGTLDTGFNGNGKITTDFGGSEQIQSIILQKDGKLVVAGASYKNGSYQPDFALARYNIDGTLDSSFSGDGKLIVKPSSAAYTDTIFLQSDGKFLIAGNSDYGFYLARYNADGTPDTGFDSDGQVKTNFGSSVSVTSIFQQSDGKLLVTGSTTTLGQAADFYLVRYNLDGSLDNTFSAPENTLHHAPTFSEYQYSWDERKILLAPTAQILDNELAVVGHYSGASVTLSRHGGASAQDVFGSTGSLSTLNQGSYFSVDSITIGLVTTNSGGTLKLSFNSNATQSLIDKALQQIGYANTSDAPPASVQIDWVFNDGNTGSQGTGGALSVTGTSTVNITATNDAPVAGAPLQNQTVSVNTPFSYPLPAGAFTDPDLEALTYTVKMANGTGAPPWISINPATGALSGTPAPLDAGTTFALRITATDAAGASVSSDFSVTVTATAPTPVNTAPTGNVTITGTPKQGQTLTAANTLADVDGLGTISYQWSASGIPIISATGSTYTLGEAEVGKTISVTASYTDGQGTAEAVTSAATAVVTSTVNTITGNSSNNVLLSTVGDDAIDGGAGIDTVSYANATAAVNVTLASNTEQDTGGAGFDTLLNIENLTGSKYNDTLTGNAAANVLNGGAGADTMTGGNGNDTYYVNHASDVVNEVLAGGTDTVFSTLLAYTLRANVEKGVVQGTVVGNLTGNALANTLTGNAAANQLNGGAGNDTLNGKAGNDILIGGAAKDVLTGGVGNDVFDFNTLAESGLTATTRDVITDFVRGQDKIDLSIIDANTALAGNQAFTGLIGANVAFTKAGQLKLNAGVLYGNTDADVAAEFSIALTGITTLTNTDFVL